MGIWLIVFDEYFEKSILLSLNCFLLVLFCFVFAWWSNDDVIIYDMKHWTRWNTVLEWNHLIVLKFEHEKCFSFKILFRTILSKSVLKWLLIECLRFFSASFKKRLQTELLKIIN